MHALLDSAPATSHWDWTFIAREKTFARVVQVHEHIETWARTSHVATGYVQYILWWDSSWFGSETGPRVSVIKSKAPNVRAACLWQEIATDTDNIQFPRLESFRTYHYDLNTSVAVSPNTWSRDNVSFISPDQVRTVWIDGAQIIDAVTAGIVILAPLTNSNDTTRSALGCSIDARWDESHHVQSDGPLNIAISADVIGARPDDSGGSGFLPSNTSDWKNIKANMDWLEALTPIVPSLPSTSDLSNSTSTIADLLTTTNHMRILPIESAEDGYGVRSGNDSPYQFWEFLLATYFAEGVARVGYSEQLDSDVFFVDGVHPGTKDCVEYFPVPLHDVNKCPEDRPKGASLTMFRIEGKRTGIKTDFISITIIFVYLLIATAHLLYTLIRRRSSQAWRNLDDLLALAHSSRPEPRVLSNTCAGIKNPHVRARKVKILTRNGMVDDEDEESGEGGKKFGWEEEQVQMVFVDGVPHDNTVLGRVEAGVKYGEMD
ncbi:MAG: hypothetical protein Q9181_004432 [Wetmoreana brouardii]